MAAPAGEREEQYLLRFEDPAIAARVRAVLREEAGADPRDREMGLDWDDANRVGGEARVGTFSLGPDTFPAALLDAPAAVEAYATLDDVHLVKAGDVGQIILVQRPGSAAPASFTSRDGVTPPMADAAARHFAPKPTAAPAEVAAAEDAIKAVVAGVTPPGVLEYVDVEEEYIVAREGEAGVWTPIQRGQARSAPPPVEKRFAGKGRGKAFMRNAINAPSAAGGVGRGRGAGGGGRGGAPGAPPGGEDGGGGGGAGPSAAAGVPGAEVEEI